MEYLLNAFAGLCLGVILSFNNVIEQLSSRHQIKYHVVLHVVLVGAVETYDVRVL